ncbi:MULTISPECIES: hypothetical protein [Rhizobium/Agrobacterium group]|uniref:hypothetical protein n=1 Tax=Rhizobium/Agrobacterium group TaxID=227290 RepID=UPI001118F810|nr:MULTISPECIES: hypothetical protein [Rhizobium/Agrobacterium group]MDH0873873.1 hypothetical protein [Agrobacterium pusense]MDH1271492.1 hypothetical protein [Agrobacterium pusense]
MCSQLQIGFECRKNRPISDVAKYSALKLEFYAKSPGIAGFMGIDAYGFHLRFMMEFGDKRKRFGARPVLGSMRVRNSGAHNECWNSEILNAK